MSFFTASIVIGIIISFLYDILRVSRRIIGPGDAIITVEDILFMGVAALLFFYAAYKKNHGEIRWQGVIGCGLGITAYIFIVRNRFLNLSIFLLRWTAKILQQVLRILLFPLILIFRVFRKPVNIIIWYTGQKIRRVRRHFRIKQRNTKQKLRKTLFLLRKKWFQVLTK